MHFRKLPDGRMFVPSRGRPPEAPEGYTTEPGNPFMFRPATKVTNKEATLKELYQHLYEDPLLNYGNASMRRCPGVKFYEFYKEYLKGRIFDFGCGRGDTVMFLRKKGHTTAYGADQVDLDNGMMVADITSTELPLISEYETALCIDVFEHILDDGLLPLMKNLSRCPRQIISVHTGHGRERGCKIDLHINRKSFEDWDKFIEKMLKVVKFRALGKQRGIFFCTQK